VKKASPMTRDHFSAVSNWYPCRILVAHAFRAVNSGTKACEARYWSCDRLRSAMVTIEGSLIFFDRSKGRQPTAARAAPDDIADQEGLRCLR
jgi:hypothetical protein